ncbi:MAG: hypothetical protein HY093_03540 [Candidatus Liptonbacteria bacterium]|nr:hypothetical protein [Candidatus Liptonbacteria bacterium]
MLFLQPTTYNLQHVRGQAALALIFLIGGTVVLLAATLAFLIFNFINSTYGYQAVNRALGVAMAGANDALIKLVRNRDYNSGDMNSSNKYWLGNGGALLGSCRYYLSVEKDRAEIEILRQDTNNYCTPSNGIVVANIPTNEAFVNVEAAVSGRRRRIEMVISINQTTGEVKVVYLRQFLSGQGGGVCYPSCN